MKNERRKKKYTISFHQWFFVASMLLIVPLLVGIAVVMWYTGKAVRDQLYAGNENLVAVYTEKLDESLSGMDRFLRVFPDQNIDLSVLAVSEDDTQRYFSKTALMAELRKTILVYDGAADGIFILTQGKEEVFLSSRGPSGSNQEEMLIRDIARSRLADGGPKSGTGWHWRCIGGENYLFNIVTNGHSCVGAWKRINNLLGPLEKIDLGEGGGVFVSAQDGTILSSAEWLTDDENMQSRTGYLRIGCSSLVSDIMVQVIISEKVVRDKVLPLQWFILGVFGVILSMVLAVAFLFERQVRRPVTMAAAAMCRIREGDLSMRVAESYSIREMRAVSESFNNMSERIETLTRDVYERTIQEQKTRLQYLQLQIKPHFILNTLNLIYSFAEIGRTDIIQKLTLSMVEYFRYNFVNTSDFVPLRGEVRHVENYLEIQEMRFPGAFCYQEEIDPTLLDMLVPPLILQTFVENSIKYAMDDERERQVKLCIGRDAQREGFVNICISDNGEGYPDEVLDKFKNGLPLSEDRKKRIGIQNVRKRLELLYGEKASIILLNLPAGGARTVLILPDSPEDKEAISCIPF